MAQKSITEMITEMITENYERKSLAKIQSLLFQLLRLLKRIRSEHSFTIIHTFHS